LGRAAAKPSLAINRKRLGQIHWFNASGGRINSYRRDGSICAPGERDDAAQLCVQPCPAGKLGCDCDGGGVDAWNNVLPGTVCEDGLVCVRAHGICRLASLTQALANDTHQWLYHEVDYVQAFQRLVLGDPHLRSGYNFRFTVGNGLLWDSNHIDTGEHARVDWAYVRMQ